MFLSVSIFLELFEETADAKYLKDKKPLRRKREFLFLIWIINWRAISIEMFDFFLLYAEKQSVHTEREMEYKCYKSCLNVCEIDHDDRSGDCWGFSDTLMTEGWVVARWMGHCDELLMLSRCALSLSAPLP